MSATPIPSMDEQEAKRRAEWLHRNNAPFDWVVVTIEEVAKIRAYLARVTAELTEERKCEESTYQRGQRDLATLRARVAELERQKSGITDALNRTAHSEQVFQQRNAELVAACDRLKASKSRLQEMIRDIEEVWGSQMTQYLDDNEDAESMALARAESATPAKQEAPR